MSPSRSAARAAAGPTWRRQAARMRPSCLGRWNRYVLGSNNAFKELPVRKTFLAAAILTPALALAHHGWSEYDSTSTLKLTGKILESGYEHPHGFVRLETPGKTWMVVLAPPSRMEFRGLGEELLQ